MEKHILSKSTFIRGQQCQKSLYLYKNAIHLRDKLSEEKKAIFNRGNKVGVLAQKLFPLGIDATPKKKYDYQVAVETTKKLINSGVEIIYEAAFQVRGVLCILDILVKKENLWYAYEVKSSAKISNTYINDAALQYWVITQSGIELNDFSIINIDTNYVKKGSIDVTKFFKTTSVLEKILEKQTIIGEKINELIQVINEISIPKINIGEHCFSPYTCDFMGQCWKDVPLKSVFEISGMTKQEQFELYNSGIRLISEIPETNKLNEHVNLQIKALKNHQVIIDKELIKQFLDCLAFPLKFIDFEIFMPAIPIYDNTQPYENIPFQYSCHELKEDGVLNHYEFLAEVGVDPRKEFLLKTLDATKGEGSILVYDALLEKGVFNRLAFQFPEYKIEIDQRLKRIVDLIKPFQEKAYYHPAFNGSFSIKNILPAIAPELSYNNLKIASGNVAMITFENLYLETDMFRREELKQDLLEYCKLDTLSMVKIYEAFKKAINE